MKPAWKGATDIRPYRPICISTSPDMVPCRFGDGLADSQCDKHGRLSLYWRDGDTVEIVRYTLYVVRRIDTVEHGLSFRSPWVHGVGPGAALPHRRGQERAVETVARSRAAVGQNGCGN